MILSRTGCCINKFFKLGQHCFSVLLNDRKKNTPPIKYMRNFEILHFGSPYLVAGLHII